MLSVSWENSHKLLSKHQWDILRGTSRSFYLSLRFLPKQTQEIIALAYLLARAADTISDTNLVANDKREYWLKAFLERLLSTSKNTINSLAHHLANKSVDEEHSLLLELPKIFERYDLLPLRDRLATKHVLEVIVTGMLLDLQWFSQSQIEQPVALKSRQELDLYCYHVAGVVGEYWSEIHANYLPSLRQHQKKLITLGINFGKGLQRINILRDIAQDLERGRCYLPTEDLESLGLTPADIKKTKTITKLRPLLSNMIQDTFFLLEDGIRYIALISKRYPQLRLCCYWPLLIGLGTLGKLNNARNLLDPKQTVKIDRKEVYQLMKNSSLFIFSNTACIFYWKRKANQLGFVSQL